MKKGEQPKSGDATSTRPVATAATESARRRKSDRSTASAFPRRTQAYSSPHAEQLIVGVMAKKRGDGGI
jgi:hypothetical protein